MEKETTGKLESKITSVTVYGDRAQVTRTAVVTLQKGEHVLSFPDLPVDTEPNSIQVNGKGKALLRDVKFRTEHFAQTPRVNQKALLDEKTSLEDKLAEINDRISAAEMEKNFIGEIEKKLVRPTRENTADELNTEKWQGILVFYRDKTEKVDAELRERNIAKREVVREIERVKREIQSLGSGETRETRIIEVKVEMQDAGELTLNASYIVYGPSWRPVYDLRVSTEDKKMHVSYNAVVRQATGEDWKDIQLKLSTAQAQISGRQPELSPWHLYIERPSYPSRAAAGAPASMDSLRMAKKEMANSQMYEAEKSDLADEAASMPPSEPEMTVEGSAVETGTTSVVFAVSGNSTVMGDNLDHKVTILLQEFPAKFRYSTAPKLSQYAYLKAQVTNTTEFPFLAGDTNIFLDNNFVSSSSIDLVAPSEEFWTFLGIDESVKVEHKILRKFHKEGMIGKKDTLVYEFLIKITNNKKTEEEIVVWDQLPISNDQNISVKLIEPQYKENTDALKKNEENFLEWFYKMKPGAKLEIPLKFSVEYPRDLRIAGL